MANQKPEKILVNQFVAHMRQHSDNFFKIHELINADCKSKKFADIEFRSKAGLHWVIEAKSHDSSDRYNTVHKFFGDLLKETGRNNRHNCRYAILVPESGIGFYSQAFRCIRRDKYLGFGKLIPIDDVFAGNAEGVRRFSWEEFYDAEKS